MNPLMPDPGQVAQPQMPQQGPSPQQIDQAHDHIDQMSQALQQLVQMPKLTKQDVFKASADLIAKGIFSTPESQMQLIQELTQLPDDEGQLRQVLGTMMLHSAQMKNNLTDNHGGPSGGGGI